MSLTTPPRLRPTLAVAAVLVVVLAVGPPSGAASTTVDPPGPAATTVGPFSGFSAEMQVSYYGRPFSFSTPEAGSAVDGVFAGSDANDMHLSTPTFDFPKYPQPPQSLQLSGSLDAGFDPTSGSLTLRGSFEVHGQYRKLGQRIDCDILAPVRLSGSLSGPGATDPDTVTLAGSLRWLGRGGNQTLCSSEIGGGQMVLTLTKSPPPVLGAPGPTDPTVPVGPAPVDPAPVDPTVVTIPAPAAARPDAATAPPAQPVSTSARLTG